MAKITSIEPYRGNHYRITVADVNPEMDIRFRNFSGNENSYNKAGERNFKLVLDEEDAHQLQALGMYVPFRENSRKPGEGNYLLKVIVSYRFTSPAVIVLSGDMQRAIGEKEIGDVDGYELTDIPHISLVTSSNRFNDTEIAHLDEMVLVKRHSDFMEKYGALLNHPADEDDMPYIQ